MTETERNVVFEMVPTTRRRSSRISAAEANTESEPADCERMNEDTKMQNTEMLPLTDTLDIDKDTVMQDIAVPFEPAQPPVIGADWKPRQGSSVSQTIERAISALHREHEAEDEGKAFHRSNNDDDDDASDGRDHSSDSSGSLNSEDMKEGASKIASVVQTRGSSASSSESDEDAQTADKREKKRMERREREREKETTKRMDKDADASNDGGVNKILTTMPIPPPRSSTATAPLPGSDLMRSLNVPAYRVNISPPGPARSSSYTSPAPAPFSSTATAAPSGYEAPNVTYGTYRCAGTYHYREMVTIDGIEQYTGPPIPVECGIEFQIRLGTRVNEMGELVNAEPFRCKACRCRMIYKVRTNKMVQFEAR